MMEKFTKKSEACELDFFEDKEAGFESKKLETNIKKTKALEAKISNKRIRLFQFD